MSSGGLPRGRMSAVGPHSGHGLGVALVDQVPLFRNGFQALLANTPGIRSLGATQHGHAAVALCERFRPDVVLIDVVLDPRGHFARLLASVNPSLAVVSLVREPYRSAQYVSEAIAGGIHGLLLRAADPGQFVEAIRRTHSERRYLDPALS
ncbi:MAG: response regulator, partial [Sciscionella sp.]